MKTVKTCTDMNDLRIDDVFLYRGRQYMLAEWGGTITATYETFIVRSVKNGKRTEIKLPRDRF